MNVIKLLKQLKQRIDQAQSELKRASYEGAAGEGAVTVTVNGAGELLVISISERVRIADVEALVMSAFAQAHAKKEAAAAQVLKRVGTTPADFLGRT